jgi:hypothetical protein
MIDFVVGVMNWRQSVSQHLVVSITRSVAKGAGIRAACLSTIGGADRAGRQLRIGQNVSGLRR